jgi:hypothetical protein
VKRVIVIAAVALIAAGCGKPGTKLYTEQASSACLQKAGVQVGGVGNADFVASSATGGAFHATLTGNAVTVSFGQTLTDADNIDQAYRRFRAKNVGIDDVLRTQGNAVMLWHQHPTDADIATVTGCLSS